MKTTSLLRKVLGAAALFAASGATMAANYPDFVINENSVAGTNGQANSALVADRLNGLYTETFTPTFLTATSGTFTTVARLNISAYYNADVLVPGALGCGFAACYNLYADFQSAGTFTINGSSISFTGNTAAIQLYLDADQILGGDTLLASTNTLLAGDGSIDTGLSNGNFEIVFGALNLTPTGEAFFIAPRPFHIVVDVNGNFTENPLLGGAISGSANAFFQTVPEPGSLALVGAALLGLGALRRRKA